jgi:ribosomal protein L20
MLTEIEEIKKEISNLCGYKELMLVLELKDLTYSKFINGLGKCGITIDRKILAEIAYDSPEAFKTIVQKAQSALN